MTRSFAIAALAAALAGTIVDRAAAEPLGSTSCAGLDVAEVERVLRIELAVVAGRVERARAPIVRITCQESTLEVFVRDATARRTLRQTLTAPPANEPGRERAVALAASQLLLSSWLEIVLEPEQAPPPVPVPARAPTPHPVTREPAFPRFSAGGGIATRLRDHREPFWTVGPNLVFEYGGRHFHAGLRAAAELGAASRDPGAVDVTVLGGGAAVGWSSSRRAQFAFGTSLSAGLAWVRAAGDRSAADYRASASSGGAFDAALGAGPKLRLDAVRLSLDAVIGITAPSLVARVDGDREVSIGGGFLGASLTMTHDI